MDGTSTRHSGFIHRLLVTDSQISRKRQDHQLSSDVERSSSKNSTIQTATSTVILSESSTHPRTVPDRVAPPPKTSIYVDVPSYNTHTLSESSLSSYSTPSGSTTRHPSPSVAEITPKGKGKWTLQKSPSSSSLSSLTSLSSDENPKCQPCLVPDRNSSTHLASTSESVPLATVPPQLSRKGVRTRRTVQSELRPLGPRHLEYDYHLAHTRFRDAIYDALGYVGYCIPSRKANTAIEPPGPLESADLMQRLKRVPSVQRASHILNAADSALEHALARGQTWENTSVPDEYKIENLDLEGLHDARGLYDSVLAMAKLSEDPQPPKKRGPGRPRTRGLLPQPSAEHQTIIVGGSADVDGKQVTIQPNIPAKRGPGRPRKQVPQTTAVGTIPPVKVEATDVVNLNDPSLWKSSQSTTKTQREVTPKRGRGRPRKQPVPLPPVMDASPVKRRPGRPRKQPQITCRSPSRDSIDSVERLLIQPPNEGNVFDTVHSLHADIKPLLNIGADIPSPVKRRPGRPRKQAQAEVVIPDSNGSTSTVKSIHPEPSNEGNDHVGLSKLVASEATSATQIILTSSVSVMPVDHSAASSSVDSTASQSQGLALAENLSDPDLTPTKRKMGRPRKYLPLPLREDGLPVKRGPGRPRKRPLPAVVPASPSKVTVKEEPCDVDMSLLDGAPLSSMFNADGLLTGGTSVSRSKKRKLEAIDDDYLLLLPTRRSERIKRPRTRQDGC